jgi:hypothetical protein
MSNVIQHWSMTIGHCCPPVAQFAILAQIYCRPLSVLMERGWGGEGIRTIFLKSHKEAGKPCVVGDTSRIMCANYLIR